MNSIINILIVVTKEESHILANKDALQMIFAQSAPNVTKLLDKVAC